MDLAWEAVGPAETVLDRAPDPGRVAAALVELSAVRDPERYQPAPRLESLQPQCRRHGLPAIRILAMYA